MRGLKLACQGNQNLIDLSHPSWVRGLKYIDGRDDAAEVIVAPFVGAWIEILSY